MVKSVEKIEQVNPIQNAVKESVVKEKNPLGVFGIKNKKEQVLKSQLIVKQDSLSKDDDRIARKEAGKKHIRYDLVIFGVLIYILGMLTGIFATVGIVEGDLSVDSFQKFFSSSDVIVADMNGTNSNANAPQGVIIDRNTKVSGSSDVGGIVSGGDSSGGGASVGGSAISVKEQTVPVIGGGSDNVNPLTAEDHPNYPVEVPFNGSD